MCNECIRMLSPVERVRSRPAVIFGSVGPEGVLEGVNMLISVFTDKDFGSECKTLTLEKRDNGSFVIKTDGKGLLLVADSDGGVDLWDRFFCKIEVMSKFGVDEKILSYFDPAPAAELDLHVCEFNLCAVQFASEYMNVESVRKGKKTSMFFRKGGLHEGPFTEETDTPDGNIIEIRFDAEVFGDIAVSDEKLTNYLQKRVKGAQKLVGPSTWTISV